VPVIIVISRIGGVTSVPLPTQCSQLSGAPVGPVGATAKSPGWDGMVKGGMFSSGKLQDGGPYNVRKIGEGDGGGRRGCR